MLPSGHTASGVSAGARSVRSVFPRETNLTLGIYSHNKNFNELDAHQTTAAGAEQIFSSFKLSIVSFCLLLLLLLLLLVKPLGRWPGPEGRLFSSSVRYEALSGRRRGIKEILGQHGAVRLCKLNAVPLTGRDSLRDRDEERTSGLLRLQEDGMGWRGLKANSLLPVWYMFKPTGCTAETPSLRSLTRLSNRDGRSLPTLRSQPGALLKKNTSCA